MLSRKTLVSETITTALTAVSRGEVSGLHGMKSLSVEANFVYGSGGTTIDVWIQTSLDGGANWIDIMQFQLVLTSLRKIHTVVIPAVVATRTNVTPLTGTLGDNLIQDGILGDTIRALVTTVGTYAGDTTLTVNAIPQS